MIALVVCFIFCAVARQSPIRRSYAIMDLLPLFCGLFHDAAR